MGLLNNEFLLQTSPHRNLPLNPLPAPSFTVILNR